MKNKLFILFLTATILSACNNDIIYEKTQDINNARWHKDSVVGLQFKPELEQSYDLYFLLRNDNNYPYSNIFLIASIEDEKITSVDTLEYEMATPEGKWLGNGIWDLKESKLIYKTNYKFSDTLTKTFSIRQAVRKTGKVKGDSILKGIVSVGIVIEKHQQQQ